MPQTQAIVKSWQRGGQRLEGKLDYGTTSSLSLKRTPLYELHREAGAKFVDFGGWEMPVQYAGIIEEHKSGAHLGRSL